MYQWQIGWVSLIVSLYVSLGVHKDGQGVSLPGKHNQQSALLKSSVLQIRGVSPSVVGGGNALLVGLSLMVFVS